MCQEQGDTMEEYWQNVEVGDKFIANQQFNGNINFNSLIIKQLIIKYVSLNFKS